MAEATKSYYVRLVKGFGVAHRRAGYTFAPGPVPQQIDLNKEQLQAIESDAAFEILKDAEGAKIVKQYSLTPEQEGSTDEQQNPDNVEGEANTPPATSPDRSDLGADSTTAMENGKDRVNDPSEDETKEDVTPRDEMTRSQLNELAKSKGVEAPEKLANKNEVLAAIEDAETPADGPSDSQDEPSDDDEPADDEAGTVPADDVQPSEDVDQSNDKE